MSPYRNRVVAAVVKREGKLLVCQRPAHKRHGGLWEFPGGKTEAGESDRDAVVRELAEELSLQVTSVADAEFSIRDEGSPFEIVFCRTHATGEPTLHEHSAVQWGTPAELLDLPLAPSDRRYLEFLLTGGAT